MNIRSRVGAYDKSSTYDLYEVCLSQEPKSEAILFGSFCIERAAYGPFFDFNTRGVT